MKKGNLLIINWEEWTNRYGDLLFSGCIVFLAFMAAVMLPFIVTAKWIFAILSLCGAIMIVYATYLRGKKDQRNEDNSIRVAHTISDNVERVIIEEYDEDGCLIERYELKRDRRFRDQFRHVINY